ncbi:MAG: RagB/SusD family nutrient uptake outer membrane protein [Chitinophagaceae bacterium]|nr:RagB/SusD family nutrient uptake outer membrane protein [Chitinophagaceae bacterium]
MQRIQHIILLLAAIALGSSSCKKYLDIVPKGKIIPEKTADYRLLLDQVNPAGKSAGFVKAFSNDLLMSDDMQVTPFSANFYGPSEQNVYSFAEHIYQDFESDPDWESLYNQVYVTNLVILQVMDSKNGSQQEKEQLMAEAKVHRAFAYLTLVNLYAKHYNVSSASTDPGVPLRKGLDFEEKLNRASVQEVYDFIIDNLKQALGHLPAAPALNQNYRPVEAAANALLARAYLYMNNMSEAFNYADASLKLYHELIDYNTLPASANFPGTLAIPGGLLNKEVLLYKSVTSASSLFYADSNLIKLYDATNDVRMKAMYASDAIFGLSFGFIVSEWAGRTPAKGPSTAEMYLTRAETYARAGKTNEALNDLNTLRSFRYKTGSNFQLSASNSADALKLVLEERRRELAFRGARWFDIKRYNTYDNSNITVTHKVNTNTYTLTPNSPRTVLPIGRKYMELNPEIKQNPR